MRQVLTRQFQVLLSLNASATHRPLLLTLITNTLYLEINRIPDHPLSLHSDLHMNLCILASNSIPYTPKTLLPLKLKVSSKPPKSSTSSIDIPLNFMFELKADNLLKAHFPLHPQSFNFAITTIIIIIKRSFLTLLSEAALKNLSWKLEKYPLYFSVLQLIPLPPIKK